MCDLCHQNGDEQMSCQDCGRFICFDVKSGDDVLRPAYVTGSGDLFCDLCGRQHDEEEEREEALDYCEPPEDLEVG